MAEINLIEVKLEDLVLAVLALDGKGVKRLPDLTGHEFLLGQQGVSGQLLGDRRRTLHVAAASKVSPGRPGDGPEIDAPMAIESGVLDGDDRLADRLRDLAQGDGLAVFQGKEPPDLASLGVKTIVAAAGTISSRPDIGSNR